MNSANVESLIKGAIDMHVHSSPDVVPRLMSDIELARSAKEAGMSGVLIKCHQTPTAARAALAMEAVGGGISVFGGLVLNNSVGGLNPVAVETEIKLGAKEVWMPTISAANFASYHKGSHYPSIEVTDQTGRLKPEVHDILDCIAASDVILGTGHLSAQECELLAMAAFERGVKKILVTHPEFEAVRMPIEMQQRLARKGVFFERCFYATNSPQKLPPQEVAEHIKAVGADTTVLSTDFGQVFNRPPVEGLKEFIATMMQYGICDDEIEIMIKKNPRLLLNIV